ncbi:hypothetical protein KM043_017317 [Ampulex compressa]|nr:hypothetical protein KM043_017317 [Ampulex compressa]
MANLRPWLAVLVVVSACTCGVRTECGSQAKISFLTSVHDDPSCRKISPKGVLMYEAARLLAEIHNNRTDGFDVELTVMDTCGSITGALKASMKALVWADTNCLQPPHYLGIIGPDTAVNAEAVHKITSVLKVPHIVRHPSSSAYLHHLDEERDTYLVQGALKILDILKWKSFTLVANIDENNEDDVQNIAKKLTMGAIERGLCVIVHDNDVEDLTAHIVHIGKPAEGFFNDPTNATVLVISEGNLEDHLNHVNSSNNILLLEDSRNEIAGLEARVLKSRWWQGQNIAAKYDTEELREVRWLEDAIEIYGRALDTLCKKKKCRNSINPIDWNNVVANILASHNAETHDATFSLRLSMKAKSAELKTVGNVIIRSSKAKLYWEGQNPEEDDDEEDGLHEQHGVDDHDDEDDMPDFFKRLLFTGKDVKSGCATTIKEIKMLHEDDDEAARVLVSEMDDTEWWTMVGTVSGVGVAMFVVGFLAVYVVYTNIKGPRSPKSSKNRERDTSLRRIGSDRELPTTGRPQRPGRGAQRRDSNRSIRSNMSDKSV